MKKESFTSNVVKAVIGILATVGLITVLNGWYDYMNTHDSPVKGMVREHLPTLAERLYGPVDAMKEPTDTPYLDSVYGPAEVSDTIVDYYDAEGRLKSPFAPSDFDPEKDCANANGEGGVDIRCYYEEESFFDQYEKEDSDSYYETYIKPDAD